ncbi:SUMF1/EgtB/PvdO family nonheme iron enzyme [Hyphomonas sp.]|uniref:nSTAND1 domain-containing NTPase n=1 Tax=Hyphomonas sp. TaxID=87 RepID=UPI00333E2A9E
MATIFISHSSRDDMLASQLETWLKANGFTDLFIDHAHIAGGAGWADALRANAGSCRVVLCLVTPNWLASSECPSEFKAAWYMGKRIIPLFLLGDEAALDDRQRGELARVRAEAQGVDLGPLLTASGLDLSRDEARAEVLKRGLREAGALAAVGLDPAAFETDRARRPSPFPGLTSFGDEDAYAALFFGRAREIAETLEWLRELRANNRKQPLVIMGASGSGKSSLLKAGIIPRLRREAPAWLPLRAFRPGADPLLNLAEAITRTLADFGEREAHGTLRRTLLEAWQACERDGRGEFTPAGRAALAAALETQGSRLRALANRPNATILISVDQAEELARSEGASGQALADYLRAAMDASSSWRLAFTIRTDSFPELQAHARFRGLEARGYDLRTLPVFRFNDVAEDPARRYGVEVDPALTDNLMEDAPGRDALPLLAFALQRLWDQFSVSGRLTHADYKSMGGLAGLIEDAAERALCGIDPEQRDAALLAGGPKTHQAELAQAVFVPALADVNDEGASIRRVAAWGDFDARQQELLDRFDRWRLVVRRDGDGGGATVEVAHEALFREWSRLRDWLEPERARLEALRGLKLAALSWGRHTRQGEFLTHFGERLKAASALERHDRYGPQLSAEDRAYLAAARKSEKRAQGQRRRLQVLSGAAVMALAAGGAGYMNRAALGTAFETHVQIAELSRDQLAALEPGAAFRDCRLKALCPEWLPEMVVLPAGTFMMGSPESDPGSSSDEYPQREVSVARFASGRFEVTHDEWAACVEKTDQLAYKADKEKSETGDAVYRVGCEEVEASGFGRDQNPVINVSWDDAQGYVRWLNLMVSGNADSGLYRLLSEAEWEYAARGVTRADAPVTRFSWGNGDPVCTRGAAHGAVFDACGNDATQPVGFSAPNPFGLHDMHGNVWEWTEDCWNETYNGAPADGAVRTSGDCSRRVVRGGSWYDGPQGLRSVSRLRSDASFRNYDVGFRVARTL